MQNKAEKGNEAIVILAQFNYQSVLKICKQCLAVVAAVI